MDLILKQVNSANLAFASTDLSTEGYKAEGSVNIDSNSQITSVDSGQVFKTSETSPAFPIATFNQYGTNMSVSYNNVEDVEDRCAILGVINSFINAAKIKVQTININQE